MTIHLNENIKRLRLERGLTQEKLAEHLGVTFQSVSRWERGEAYPDITMLTCLAGFFSVTTDELLGFGKAQNEEKARQYIEMYDNMKLNEQGEVFEQYLKAVKQFPADFRILVRFMELLQQEKLFGNSAKALSGDEWKKTSREIHRIYESIQNHCTDDSIRIRAKRIMISHLMWKYDCISDEKRKYHTNKKWLNQAREIVDTLPSIRDSRELSAICEDSESYFSAKAKALSEIIYLLFEESFGFCLEYPPKKRLDIFIHCTELMKLLFPNGNYGKNMMHMLYSLGHIGHLYHQCADDEKALKHLKIAAEYAKEIDSKPDERQKLMCHYNFGPEYRESTACEFMKLVMSEHYPLSDEFKSKNEFTDIINSL